MKALLTISGTIMCPKMDDTVIKILKEEEKGGLSITDLVIRSRLSRSAIRIILAKLEGAEKVKVRKVGMAKLYSLKDENFQK